MKLRRFLSLLAAVLLLVSSFPVAQATDLTTATLPVAEDQYASADEQTNSFGSVCILSGCRTLDGMVPLAGSDHKADTAQSVVIYEKSTNTMIYSYNPDASVSTSGLTKILTALIVIEHCPDLNAIVTCEPGIASRSGTGRTIKLKSEEQLTINDLLHCMIMQSANDAAVALAEHVAGTRNAFVEMMNAKVKELGCGNTSLTNVHGLDDGNQRTTARDMARIVQACTDNATFRELFAAQSYTVPATNMSEQRKFASENYLMESTIVPKYNDPNVTGGFASYSDATGASIVCTASTTTYKTVDGNRVVNKQGLDLVVVLMGAKREFRENGWSVLTYGNFEEVLELLDWTYNSFKWNAVIYDGQALKQFPVAGGESDVVAAPREVVTTVLPNAVKMDNLIKRYTTVGGGLSAPVKKGAKVATVEIWYQSSCLLEAELFSLSNVKVKANDTLKVQGEENAGKNSKMGFIALVILAVILLPVGIYLAVNSYRRSKARERYRRRMAAKKRSRNL